MAKNILNCKNTGGKENGTDNENVKGMNSDKEYKQLMMILIAMLERQKNRFVHNPHFMRELSDVFFKYLYEYYPDLADEVETPMKKLNGKIKARLFGIFDKFVRNYEPYRQCKREFKYKRKSLTNICIPNIGTFIMAIKNQSKKKYSDKNNILTIANEDDFLALLYATGFECDKRNGYIEFKVSARLGNDSDDKLDSKKDLGKEKKRKKEKKGKKEKSKRNRRKITLVRYLYMSRYLTVIPKNIIIHHEFGFRNSLYLVPLTKKDHGRIHSELRKQGLNLNELGALNTLKMSGNYTDKQLERLRDNLLLLAEIFHLWKGVKVIKNWNIDMRKLTFRQILNSVELF